MIPVLLLSFEGSVGMIPVLLLSIERQRRNASRTAAVY
jgi:hypothetical protein